MKDDRVSQLHQKQIDNHGASATDLLKRWLTTLAVGNGAGFVGLFGLLKDEVLMLPNLLPSAWLFFFGVVSASVASFSLSVASRHSESYWAGEDAMWVRDQAKLPPDDGLKDETARAEKSAEDWHVISGLSALISASLFLLAVLIPLSFLTYRVCIGTYGV